MLLLLAAPAFASAQAPAKGLKIFISVDMEGISGVVNWDDVT
jgi:hypothetical protein